VKRGKAEACTGGGGAMGGKKESERNEARPPVVGGIDGVSFEEKNTEGEGKGEQQMTQGGRRRLPSFRRT